MKNCNDDRLCANEGCPRIAEEGSRFCASCDLEWSLFHRDARQREVGAARQ